MRTERSEQKQIVVPNHNPDLYVAGMYDDTKEIYLMPIVAWAIRGYIDESFYKNGFKYESPAEPIVSDWIDDENNIIVWDARTEDWTASHGVLGKGKQSLIDHFNKYKEEKYGNETDH